MTTPTPEPSFVPSKTTDPAHRVAIFGMGCFWSVQARFDKVPGVVETAVGYCGGDDPGATYEQVCAGETGHAEVVRVVYDPGRVTYTHLLEQFWEGHDPTTLNRQGPDVGTQYRSAIFTTTDEQADDARRSLEVQRAAGRYGHRDIVTQIAPAGPFVRAEEYHQKFLAKRGMHSCRL